MTVTLLTKRVLVAAGHDLQIAVFDAEHNRAPMLARLPLPPVMQAGQISHLDAWRLVRAELRGISGSPALVAAYAHFMTMVEDQTDQHTFPFAQQAAQAVLQRMQAPAAIAAPVGGILVSQAHKNKTLLVHMITGLPGAKPKDAWTYDLRLIASDPGYEVCSLTLVLDQDTLYGCPYGLFAVVPEEETLAIGINDLGVNQFKKEHAGKNSSQAELRELLQEKLQRTHKDDLVQSYSAFAAARKAAQKTPSNEIVANLKKGHLIGICVNLVHLEDSRLLARTRPKRDADLIRIRAEVENISNAVFRETGLRLKAWTYNYRNGALAEL